eukprot:TRINITY_DN2003_c0_g1_i5.p1 TRINITY_DN2003_c0_g1~~TRINITY_DN2003_c0_g1_i5.p1  ORF type:complete len:963 (+),score=195.54 TRINITY_DN2003_c0_g1_i5:123-3011(+)
MSGRNVPFGEAIKKATDSKSTPPKRKHVRVIILEVHRLATSHSVFIDLNKRGVERSPIIALKALNVIHSVLQEGPHLVLDECHYKLSFVNNIQGYYNSHQREEYSYLVASYANYIIQKITFHRKYPIFEGNLSLEKFNATGFAANMSLADTQETVRQLCLLEDFVLNVQAAVIDDPTDSTRGRPNRVLSELRTYCFIPLVADSYSVYLLITSLLQRAAGQMDTLDAIQENIDRFYELYPRLRDFFLNASAIRSVASVATVPTLPLDPPEFLTRLQREALEGRSRPPPPPVVIAAPPPQPQPVYVPPPQPIYTPPPQQEPQQQWNPFANAAPQGWTNPFTQPQEDDEFSRGLSSAWTAPPQPVVYAQPEPVMAAAPYTPPQMAEPLVAPTPVEPEPVKIMTKVITKTIVNNDEVIRLSAIVQELERSVATWNDKVEGLNNKLNTRENEITSTEQNRASVREANQRIGVEIQDMHEQNQALRAQIEKQRELLEADRRGQFFKEMAGKKHDFAAFLKHLETQHDIASLDGGVEVTSEMVQQDIQAVSQNAAHLLALVDANTNDDASSRQSVYEAAGHMMDALKGLFQKSKGLASNELLTKYDGNLAEAGAGGSVQSELLSHLLMMQTQAVGGKGVSLVSAVGEVGGRYKTDQEAGFVREVGMDLQHNLGKLLEVAQRAGALIQHGKHQEELRLIEQQRKQRELEESGINLEDLAERELVMAARAIEEAARKLMEAKHNKAKDSQQQGQAGFEDISEAIYEAAIAIAQATAQLVATSADAQRERVKYGMVTDPNDTRYKADSVWAEGLVSAARAVAGATGSLVSLANDAVLQKGRFDPVSGTGGAEEALVAISKSVAASTSQLVSAARSKSVPYSQTGGLLNTVGKKVSRATDLLLSAAGAAGMWQDKDKAGPVPDYAKMNPHLFKIRMNEQQALVLKLEQELVVARSALATIRREAYAAPVIAAK